MKNDGEIEKMYKKGGGGVRQGEKLCLKLIKICHKDIFPHKKIIFSLVIKVFPFQAKDLIVFLLIIFIFLLPLVPLCFATYRIDIWYIIYGSSLVVGFDRSR